MPLTDIQREVLKTIAANRSPDSYLAGATILHRQDSSPRYSRDLDYFHDVAASVAQSAETDGQTLQQSGYQVEWLLRTPHFYRALVSSNTASIRLDWAQDSAFRFFPVLADRWAQRDPEQAVAWTQTLKDDEQRPDIVSAAVMAWAGKDPVKAAEWVQSLEDEEARADLLSRLDRAKALREAAEARKSAAEKPQP